MRPFDFAFTSAAMRSIICTDGCVAATTSPQRIVTCCACAGGKRHREPDCDHPALHGHPFPVRARERELTNCGF